MSQLSKFAKRLLPPEEQEAFLGCFENQPPQRKALVWLRKPEPNFAIKDEKLFSFAPEFVSFCDGAQRPGSTEFHAQGDYYVLDSSSFFSASVLLAVKEAASFVLDMCSAPGGKAVFASRLFSPDKLLCNETIKKRSPQLLSNLKRCKISNAILTNSDSGFLASVLADMAQLVIVDAPCSGQSMLLKGLDIPGCFHPLTIKRNASRQKRILANAITIAGGGGHIAYMTCTFSREENEDVIAWALKKFDNVEVIPAPHLSEFQSALTDFPCYRLWPQSNLGLGAFTALLRKKGETTKKLSLENIKYKEVFM